ncbi:hypothetical protein HMPREF1574_00825 [Gardnerella pickettii JCP7659]|uniref:Uncharacterized protein n=1 Tax=Gardnerella pickettii JCP8017A TaxID=1261062 RepID=T2PK33_9BIFI|nr:hypothetical protein HMPREF1577_00964 [Gardnerella pickettii JCP8017A]EPI55001.1 hypothetical protein HMPREF1574_00825 [Gardnerella pickettii JCP7659]EPI61694.1 hypothetical protein HMPREF1578_00750 [Gardnerella pickettii JCP8017B]
MYSQIHTYKSKGYNVVRIRNAIRNTIRNVILKIDIEHAKMYG